jgi:hypothetical protein
MKFFLLTAAVLMVCGAMVSAADYDDGMLLNVQEVDLEKMRNAKMSGSEAILLVAEQFTNHAYRYAFVSKNYLVDGNMLEYINFDPGKMTVVVAGYPSMNNLLYTQVFYNNRYFFIALAKRETDYKRISGLQVVRVNYEKGNKSRRDNLKKIIQENNVEKVGIHSQEMGN